ncbi:M48 family metalloprotease [Halorussus marinus]|uniref:hypothetical protein n=1 Tax=Halorussus marinus TaxID=2505976 RepID=UPI0010929512|nr:hypothetical protein [Halorussus marinus]
MASLLPSVGPLAAVAAVSVASFAALRLVAWWATKAPPKRAMARIRRALAVGLPATGLAALFAALATDALELTDTVIRAASPFLAASPIGAVLTWVPTLAGVVVAVVAGYLGAFPSVRALRDAELSAAAAALGLGRWLAVFLGLVVAAVGSLSLLPPGLLRATGPLLGVLVAAIAVLLAAQPRLVGLFRSTRAPTDAERDRLDRLADRVGLSPRSVAIMELDGDPTATAMLAGLPGRRHLLVTDYLLDRFDDDVVAAVLASRAGRARRYYREYKLLVVLIGAGVAIGALSGDVSALADLGTLPFVGLYVGLLVALAAVGKRLVFAADDDAVDRVGAETYAEALEAIADEHRLSYESGRLAALVAMRPPLGDRLDRLWGRFED